MKKTIALIIVLAVILIGGGIGGVYYFNEVANYISTDDATVQGDLVTITPTQPGKLTDWKVKEGDAVHKGDVLGTVQMATGASVNLVAPQDGTIIKSQAITDEVVAPGMTLATTSDLSKLYVVANVLETDINDIQANKTVKVTVDAFPGTTFDAHVQRIGGATQSTFSLLPSTNDSGNYTKVAQRVPVVITFDSYNGKQLIPGLNAYVKIEK